MLTGIARARALLWAVSVVHSSNFGSRRQKSRKRVADGGKGDSELFYQVEGAEDAAGIEDSPREGPGEDSRSARCVGGGGRMGGLFSTIQTLAFHDCAPRVAQGKACIAVQTTHSHTPYY